jgi:drug/metabolite transporter (DMT)-like permease
MSWVLPISLLIVFELIADIFAKEWQLHGSTWRWMGALGAYLVANSFWLFALKNGSGLARGGLIFAVSCAVMAVVVGMWMYREEVTKVQTVGIILGLFSLCLIFWDE